MTNCKTCKAEVSSFRENEEKICFSCEEKIIAGAVNSGLKDKSYSTTRYPREFGMPGVSHFSGKATVTMFGRRWEVTGHRSQGNPNEVTKQGYCDIKESVREF